MKSHTIETPPEEVDRLVVDTDTGEILEDVPPIVHNADMARLASWLWWSREQAKRHERRAKALEAIVLERLRQDGDSEILLRASESELFQIKVRQNRRRDVDTRGIGRLAREGELGLEELVDLVANATGFRAPSARDAQYATTAAETLARHTETKLTKPWVEVALRAEVAG
ncbi:MAG: hypothetical protein ACOC9T_00080 [Myxococcota bacterium]